MHFIFCSADSKGGRTRNDELFNDLVDLLRDLGVGFHDTLADTDGRYIIQSFANALWYITNQHTTINDAACHKQDVIAVPQNGQNFKATMK